MKSLKMTHLFDDIKKEIVYEDEHNAPTVIHENNDVKQEYYCKEELDVAWDERDNNLGSNQENHNFLNDSSYKSCYPIVLIERLREDVANKYLSGGQHPKAIGTLDATESNRKSFIQHYQKFCLNCNTTQSSAIKNLKCMDCNSRLNYECKRCRKRLPSRGGIIHHLTAKCMERGYYYTCFVCDYKSVHKFRVKKHLETVHSFLHSLNSIGKINSENVQSNVIFTAKLHKCLKCGKPFKKLSTLLKHIQICGQTKYANPSDNLDATVRSVQDKCVHHCVKCNQTVKNDKVGCFSTKKCQSCHSKFSFKCKKCNQIFHSYNGLNQHLKIIHTDREDVLKCPECDYETSFIDYLTKHVTRKHFVETHECPKCGGKYKNRNAFKNHSLYCKKEPEFQCDYCSYQTKTKMCLKRHIFQVHTTGNDIDCPQCGVTLKNYIVLKVHLKYCKKQPHHRCASCSYITKHKNCLTKHYESAHSIQKKATCLRCAKEFKNRKSLESHIRRCMKSADLSCNYCSRLFKSKQNLIQHITRVHSKDDNVDSACNVSYLHCDDCTYKTKFKGDLVKHVIRHLQDNVKECPKCNKYLKNEYFKRHAEYCGKEALRCHLCIYQSFTKDSLRKHIFNMHSEGNEIACSRCGRTCKNKKYLTAHLKRCGTNPHLQCEHCSYKTKYNYTLKKHIEKMHSNLKKRRIV